jgi:hypothetical protein
MCAGLVPRAVVHEVGHITEFKIYLEILVHLVLMDKIDLQQPSLVVR